MSAPTAPLPPAAVSAFASPPERLRRQIARLEESLRIQREGRDSDLVQMRNVASSELERAEAEGSFRSTVREIRFIQRQLAELRTELLEAVSAECRSRSAAAVTAEDFEQLLCVQDELAMCRRPVASDEHGKTKPPLPVRPPRPHPHAVTGVAS